MQRFILRRFFQAIIALFFLSIAIFLMGRISGDPCNLLLPDEAGEEAFILLRKHLGLDRPLYVQYSIWLQDAVTGNFGKAYVSGKPVLDLVKERFPNSIKLGFASMLLTTLISFPLGLLAAVKKGTWVDTVCKILAVMGQAMPGFWIGIMLIWIFAANLKVLPAAGIGGLKYYILPVCTMGWWSVAAQTRLLRSSMLEVLDSEFVKMARIKGVSEGTIVWKHTLRNALIPVVSFMGMYFAHIITMAMITEVVYAWPGMGRLLYDAIRARDFPVVQAVVVIVASLTVWVNLAVDILYAYIDPRIRYG